MLPIRGCRARQFGKQLSHCAVRHGLPRTPASATTTSSMQRCSTCSCLLGELARAPTHEFQCRGNTNAKELPPMSADDREQSNGRMASHDAIHLWTRCAAPERIPAVINKCSQREHLMHPPDRPPTPTVTLPWSGLWRTANKVYFDGCKAKL